MIRSRTSRVGLLLSMCGVVLANICWSQSAEWAKKKYKFAHLNIKLENNRIECITQDSYGYIWIGTLGGLHKYDGTNVVSYPPSKDSTTLDADRLDYIFEDSKKRIWISTDEGIYQYLRASDTFRKHLVENPLLDEFSVRPVRAENIIEDHGGIVWIASERGLQYFDEVTKSFKRYFTDANDPYSTAHFIALAEADDQTMWFVTEQYGLSRINPTTGHAEQCCQNDPDAKRFTEAWVYKIIIDQKNRLWISTNGRGLGRIDLNENQDEVKFYTHNPNDENSLFNDMILNVYEDRKGQIWTSNENGGLHLFNEENDNFIRFLPDDEDPESITSLSMRLTYEDRQGRLWLGNHLNGIDIYDPYLGKFKTYIQSKKKGSLSHNVVRNFYEDNKGNLWIATDGGGLNYFDRKKDFFEVYMTDNSNSNGLNSNAVLDIEEDSHGKLWLGTWRGGINVFDPLTKQFTQPYSDISDLDRVFYILKDHQDHMWVGDYQVGVSEFDHMGIHIRTFQHEPADSTSLVNRFIICLLEDSQHRIWVGTEYNGLNRLSSDGNRSTFIRYNADNEGNQSAFVRSDAESYDSHALPNMKVNGLFEDSKKRVWVANDGGLCLYRDATDDFKVYGTDNGLATNAIKSIEEDDHGNLWLGTSQGITKFNPETEEVRNYASEDGVQPGGFSRYSALKLSTGEMAFGGYEGFNLFHPDSLVDNPHPPVVRLVGIKVFNEPLSIGTKDSPLQQHASLTQSLTFKYNQSVITFEYVGINFTQSERNQYAYRLVGFEDDWNYVGNRRDATYTNLDPGTYTFEIRASNNDGVWTDETLAIQVIIVPPWWQTLWFKILLVVFLLMSILGFIRYRTYSLLKEQVRLEKMVDERTREVKKLNQDLTISEKMASLGVFTAGIAHEINNPINFISGATQKLFDLYEIKMEREEKGSSSEEERKIFGDLKAVIKTGIDRTTQIVNSLRNYARNEKNKFEKYNIVQCCEDSLLILSHKLNLANIDIVRDYGKYEIVADCLPGKMGQIFVNLISNAVDALNEKGQIKISIKESKSEVHISISDTGEGIDNEKLSKLFDPFFSTKEVGKGTGLGLYIVYGIVEEHNGHIQVQSNSHGTVFSIQMPIVHQSKMAMHQN